MIQNHLLALLPEDQANLILIMFLSIPLSYIFSLIYNRYILLAFSMTLTIGFQSILFPEQKWFLWGQQQLVYLIIILAPRKSVGHIILIESFLALSLIQLRRIFVTSGDNRVDITAIFMMQLFNYIGLGYNYQNGAKPQNQLSADQIKRRVVERPEYLTYLGYVNFMPACLVGPPYEYTEFEDYLLRRKDYTSIPSTILPSIKEFGIFCASIAIYLATNIFYIERVLQPSFQEYNLGFRLIYSILAIVHIELKYVSAWSLGMVSMKASGITYNPQKNTTNKDNSIAYDFSKIEVTDIAKFYGDPAIKVKAESWNMGVQVALRRYIYENLYSPANQSSLDEKTKKKKQFQAQLGTVVVSALWHGLYPGYYITFVNWVFYAQTEKEIFRLKKNKESAVAKVYEKYGKFLSLIQNFTSTFVLCYFGMAFHLLKWENIKTYLSVTYCLPYFILYISFYLVTVLKILQGGRKKPKTEDKKD